MANYSYVAKDSNGQTLNGSIEAASEQALLKNLHSKSLTVIEIKEAKGRGSKAGVSSDGKAVARGGRVKMDDLAIFARQLATLVDAGIPIVSGLDALADQLENRTLQQVVTTVKNDVEGGTNLTAAIAKHSRVFSPLFISLVRAGEASGHLAEVLGRLAIYLEKSAAIQRKVKSAMVYPTVVISMASLITIGMVVFVVPTFKDVFSTFGATLPLPTRILLATSDITQKYFLLIIGGVFAGIFLFKRMLKTKPGRLWFDRNMLKAFLVGPIIRKVAIAKFSRTLATLVKSGVQILQALEIVSESSGNMMVSEAILKVRVSIREGENIAAPLAASKVFPPLVVRMIAVGEQTGRLDDMLVKVAEFYEEQVDAAVSGLTSAIEPLIIAVMGVIIGGIVMAIFLPIFQMSSLVSH